MRPRPYHWRSFPTALLLMAALPLCAAADGAPGETSLSPAHFGASDEQLAGLVGVLLEENPRLHSAKSDSDSRRERAPQASSLPDPLLTYRYYASAPETRVGPMQHALELSQTLPWGGKRSSAASRDEHRASSADWSTRDLARLLVVDLKRSYFEAAYLQQALRVNAEERILLRDFEGIALRRYATGGGIQQDVIKVQTEISRLEDQRTDLTRLLAAAERRIGALIGRPQSMSALNPINLPTPPSQASAEELTASALENHPRVSAAREMIEAEREWARRRRLDSRPDFRLGLAYTMVGDRRDGPGVALPPEDNGQDIVALSLGINLPVHRTRNRAGVAEAEASVRAREHDLRAIQDGLHYQIEESGLRFRSLVERSRLHADVIIPQAQASVDSARAAYTTNRQGFLDLLDAQRVLFEAQRTFSRILSDAWIALADLELAINRPLPE